MHILRDILYSWLILRSRDVCAAAAAKLCPSFSPLLRFPTAEPRFLPGALLLSSLPIYSWNHETRDAPMKLSRTRILCSRIAPPEAIRDSSHPVEYARRVEPIPVREEISHRLSGSLSSVQGSEISKNPDA